MSILPLHFHFTKFFFCVVLRGRDRGGFVCFWVEEVWVVDLVVAGDGFFSCFGWADPNGGLILFSLYNFPKGRVLHGVGSEQSDIIG